MGQTKSGTLHSDAFSTILVSLNKNLPNLNSQDQTIAHIKADLTS